MSPKRPTLSWEEVVEYAFLANFDLLRESRQDIRDRPWSRPAIRTLIDKYFKIERAKEEICRLNIEIKRVVTHIRDEEEFLLGEEKRVAASDPLLSHHIQLYRLQRTKYNGLHMTKFHKLATLSGFSGSLTPGVPKNKSLLPSTRGINPTVNASAGTGVLIDMSARSGTDDPDVHDDETQGPSIEDEIRDRFETVLAISF